MAKFMQQFEVNRETRRISRILKVNESNEIIENTSSLRRSTYVDRMSRRVASAKAFLDEKKPGFGAGGQSESPTCGITSA